MEKYKELKCARKVEQDQAKASPTATAKAKAVQTTTATKNHNGCTEVAYPKKDDTSSEAVYDHPCGTENFASPMYGRCRLASNRHHSYVQHLLVMPDRKKWKAIMCISSPNHHWACQYLRYHLEMPFPKGAINEIVAASKKHIMLEGWAAADRMLADAGNDVEPESEPG